MLFRYTFLWSILCTTHTCAAVVPPPLPLEFSATESLREKLPPKKGKKKNKEKKVPKSMPYIKYVLTAMASALFVWYIMQRDGDTDNNEENLCKELPLILDLREPIPDFKDVQTQKDQDTYKIDRKFGTFYKYYAEKEDRIGLKRLEDDPDDSKKEQEYTRLCGSIDKNYDIYDVRRDGHCVPYSVMIPIIHYMGAPQNVQEDAHKNVVKQVKELRVTAKKLYEKLTNPLTDADRSYVQAEKTTRLKEAVEIFLRCTPVMLALFNELEHTKGFKNRVALMNRVNRFVISGFMRSAMMILQFNSDPENFIAKAKFLDNRRGKMRHLLDSDFWMDPLCDPVEPLLTFLGIPIISYTGTYNKDIKEVSQRYLVNTFYKKCSEDMIRYGKQVLLVFNHHNHFFFAVDPDLMQ